MLLTGSNLCRRVTRAATNRPDGVTSRSIARSACAHLLDLPRMRGTTGAASRRGRPRRRGAAPLRLGCSPSLPTTSASRARSASKRSRARGPSPNRTPPSRSAFAYTQSRATPSSSARSRASIRPTLGRADATSAARCSASDSISTASSARKLPRRVASSSSSCAITAARRDDARAATDLSRSLRMSRSEYRYSGRGSTPRSVYTGGLRASPRAEDRDRREAPHGHAEHHETQDHDHARLEERGQVPAEPSKADQDATFTSLSWTIGASLA